MAMTQRMMKKYSEKRWSSKQDWSCVRLRFLIQNNGKSLKNFKVKKWRGHVITLAL